MPTCHQKVLWRQWIGITIASTILLLWLISLIGLMQVDLATWAKWQIGLMIVLRMLLQTGLFITAHDAMHGTIVRSQPQLNAKVGKLMLLLYAFLSYDACLQRHVRHHHGPTQSEDPDFHTDQHLVAWYWHFMRQYLDVKQAWQVIGGIVIGLSCVMFWQPSQFLNLLLFWLVPLILSSLQLFYFGVYLPHRQPQTIKADRHFARSLAVPQWLSFLMCYHFGYHWEHHEYPHVPWYELPKVRFADQGQATSWQIVP
jgi:beta-carotene/zeaxanthin 4-ketolase